ncbi:MAG: hypothetical protein P8Y17_02825 [Patescibacteria group bacterium]
MAKETSQPNNESLEKKLDRLSSEIKDYHCKENDYAHIFADRFGERLIGAVIETSADDFYVVRDIIGKTCFFNFSSHLDQYNTVLHPIFQ